MTTRSFPQMLNQNIYSAIKKQDQASKELMSKREKLRNNIIDETGYKPETKELNKMLASQASQNVLKKIR